ncbi:MAG: CoB--CoM heterodisulfide reductase subunit B [Candidatus Heimdallarchaeota archaeon]|nr:MAG: CoB--CoM heterodisulfide reductase subunit B [Candidatus Heimdallarchaeota archaeon]
MTKFAFFVGCTIPYRIPFVEITLRRTLPEFGIELVDLPFACCPDPGGVQGFDSVTWHTLAARNLCLAEEQNLNIVTACSGCFETLKVVNTHLKNDTALKTKVNGYLKEINREFQGSIEVKHFAEVFYDDIGIDKIAAKVQNPLSGLKLATHTGCHFLKPPEILQTDNPERPTKLDEMVEALGAQSVPYLNKLSCCGAGTRGVNQDTAVAMAHEKIVGAERANADALVTVCPTCYVQYDVGQRLMAKQFEKTNLPVFVYPELLGLSMGIDFSAGFKMHTIKVAPILEKIAG